MPCFGMQRLLDRPAETTAEISLLLPLETSLLNRKTRKLPPAPP
jgi:hypothetical protein